MDDIQEKIPAIERNNDEDQNRFRAELDLARSVVPLTAAEGSSKSSLPQLDIVSSGTRNTVLEKASAGEPSYDKVVEGMHSGDATTKHSFKSRRSVGSLLSDGALFDNEGHKRAEMKFVSAGDIDYVKQAKFFDQKGTEIASLQVNGNQLEFTYRDPKTGQVIKENIIQAENKDGSVIMITQDGRTLERRNDGSFVQYDKQNRPTMMFDAAGNCFEYTWEDNNSEPTKVVVQGPGTQNQRVSFVPINLVDRAFDPDQIIANGMSSVPFTGHLAGYMYLRNCPTRYKVLVNETPKETSFSVGGAAGPNGVNVGFSAPVLAVLQLQVLPNGELKTFAMSNGWGAILTREQLTTHYHGDGTLDLKRANWLEHPPAVHYDKNGKGVDIK